jgi:hypothetical protein
MARLQYGNTQDVNTQDASPWTKIRGRKSMDGNQLGDTPSPSKATVLQSAHELCDDGRRQHGATWRCKLAATLHLATLHLTWLQLAWLQACDVASSLLRWRVEPTGYSVMAGGATKIYLFFSLDNFNGLFYARERKRTTNSSTRKKKWEKESGKLLREKEKKRARKGALKPVWHTPKSLVKPTWGSRYVELRKVRTWGPFPTSNIKRGVEGAC